MSNFGAFSRGLTSGAQLGAQLVNLEMNAERQAWQRYEHEKSVEGDKLNALMNVATSQYNGDISAMSKSPAGLQMMFDFVKDDPRLKQQLESNKGWRPAGMYRDDQTGNFGIVVANEDGERKPLTIDRAAGSASFELTEDDLLRTFAAAAGRTGQKDTLTMNRMLNIVNNMEGVDKEEAKRIVSSGEGGVDIPTAPSIQNVSKAARDNRATSDANQLAYSTVNAPATDPKSGATSPQQLHKPDTENVPKLGAPALGDTRKTTREETQEDYDAVALAEADLAAKQSDDKVIATVQQGVASGVVSPEEGDGLIERWKSGALSANGVTEELGALVNRARPNEVPADRTTAMNRLVSGRATLSDLAFEEQGVAPPYGGQAYTDAPQTTVPQQAPSTSILGDVRGIGGIRPEQRVGEPAQEGSALGLLGKLPAQRVISTAVESIPEGTAEYIASTPEAAGAIYDAVQQGDYKKAGKVFGTEAGKAAGLAKEFVTSMTTAAEEGWAEVSGVAADLFGGVSEGFSGDKAQATVKVIDDKTQRAAENAEAPEKAKTEAARQRISTSTANDPEKLANTTQVIRAQTSSLTPGERVVKDAELMQRAFAPAKKPSAKQKYAATYLLTSGMISEGAYRHYMTTGEWSPADRQLAQSELAFRHQYVRDRISLMKLQKSAGVEGAKEAKKSFEDASQRSSPIVASAVMNSPSLVKGQDMSGEKLNKYSSLLLDAYLDNPLLLSRLGVDNKYRLSPEQINFVAENIATEISNGTLVFQKPSKAEDSSLFSTNYWFGEDKEGINPLSQRDISAKVQGWFSKEKQ